MNTPKEDPEKPIDDLKKLDVDNDVPEAVKNAKTPALAALA
jgi:hypothetical protein